jgi:hypothetical protein
VRYVDKIATIEYVKTAHFWLTLLSLIFDSLIATESVTGQLAKIVAACSMILTGLGYDKASRWHPSSVDEIKEKKANGRTG